MEERDPLEPRPARKTPEGMMLDELREIRALLIKLVAVATAPKPTGKKKA
jgi:hypothetical protein